MPIDGSSKIQTILFCGNTSFGSTIISPIPSGAGNNITVGSGLVEISPTSGNIYAITYLTLGTSSFSFSQGSSVFSYTHGGTRLIQNASHFY
jgi:hypothetical protein